MFNPEGGQSGLTGHEVGGGTSVVTTVAVPQVEDAGIVLSPVAVPVVVMVMVSSVQVVTITVSVPQDVEAGTVVTPGGEPETVILIVVSVQGVVVVVEVVDVVVVVVVVVVLLEMVLEVVEVLDVVGTLEVVDEVEQDVDVGLVVVVVVEQEVDVQSGFQSDPPPGASPAIPLILSCSLLMPLYWPWTKAPRLPRTNNHIPQT